MLHLILLMNAEFSSSIYRGLFTKSDKLFDFLFEKDQIWYALKMKVDDNPFLGDQNMVDARLLKGKTKVLTSTRSRETRTVDPEMQILADEYREIRRRRNKQKSRYEQGETSKDGATKPRVTSWILLNKWHHQKEKDY